ncbi:hypothetical protein F5Y18DRAFT_396429 [Xylariaceae sp. FL1019]|nr:hypothetical protein F5Y18DRAFT_396429 [Xylariaceae sp. FL1019]
MATTTVFLGSINDSHKSAFQSCYDGVPQTVSEVHHTVHAGSSLQIPDFVHTHLLTWSTLWFSLLCLFILANGKNMPFVWHMRILNAFRFTLRTQRPKVPITPSHLFQPIITTSTAQLGELDFNLHKSNSSYFADVDIARTHLVCTLFTKGIEKMRGGTGSYTGAKNPLFGLALGGVSCTFKKEVKPYQEYEMWSKILTWDEKWIYIVTHFVRKGVKPANYSLYPQQSPASTRPSSRRNSNAGELDEEEVLRRSSIDSETDTEENPEKHIFATCLSKCVFKSGRKTISPKDMMEMSGLLPTAESSKEKHMDITKEEFKIIEEQRLKGMKMAHLLGTQNQQSLEAEFEGNGSEVLGRHTDGTGTAGVVSTLMQLGRMKRSQLL